jgi:hypothetical protein
LRGFARFIGEGTAFEAGLWGILDGLILARSRVYQHVELQIDYQAIVSCLTNNNMERNNMCILIGRIRNFMKENWRMVIKHVYREGNKIFDGLQLALLACITKVSISLYEQMHTEVAKLYHDDLNEVSTTRLIVL